tara:strand:+ start:319 stop:1041 length:723 start_codon:yes stop_codon:yes gene_type:complete
MNTFNQQIITFEDEFFNVEFPIIPIQYNIQYNLAADDNIWWGCSTTFGGVSILEKANSNWDGGIFTGNILSSITTNTTDATINLFQYTIPTLPGEDGGGAKITTQQTAGVITYAFINDGGVGYEDGDTLTLPSSALGSTTDAIITLTSNNLPTEIPPSTGNIYLTATDNGTGPALVTVEFTQDDYEASGGPLETGETYYWELIAGETLNYSAIYNVPTQVIAQGTLQVRPSIFSAEGYRP